ncbi:hypothetical protein TCAL_00440 [Tigriopus californicus]|uniref:Uncharacterized protein n=1 Tax=Tigriopus californicus TaxID=6832 RepID=A0A553NFG9_TIGCA|nr:probable phosphatase phospho1 [Tigriopus californicus]TRY64119.1 hypothetical protein TCAL_00440 [Tigriopus californicus]|eukprot:TCALIF_00440-PA protein Name:"Similar to phospho1 Probable phosphatase phospho1 (Danio rerio)" AED:0.00 eAED:0.00 QI:0/-1/0/1/-1/1/1/0/245
MKQVQGVLAFDFDDTLITNVPEETILRWCAKFTEPGDLPKPSMYMKDIVDYQNDVFSLVFKKGKTIQDILNQVDFKYMSPGMIPLIEEVRSRLGFKIMIVTDNNSVVLEHSLKSLGVAHLIDEIVVNPAKINPQGQLVVSPWQIQDHCPLSFRNLCKGQALFEYVEKLEKNSGRKVDFVGYCGDNRNDVCPALRLRAGDIVFPRAGHPLVQFLEDKQSEMKADIVPWSTGQDILNAIDAKLKTLS